MRLRISLPAQTGKCRSCGGRIVLQDPALFGHGAWFHFHALPGDALHMGVPK